MVKAMSLLRMESSSIGNTVYYGYPAEKYVAMLQILGTSGEIAGVPISDRVLNVGTWVLCIAVILFTYSSYLGFFVEYRTSVGYLFGEKSVKINS
mgnify:CR=1 FL=1